MSQVEPMPSDMVNKGFTHYDVEDKRSPSCLGSCSTSGHAGKGDYDVLQFNSNSPDGVNGTINLLNNDLALKGVSRITMSDYPRM
ncbi:MAG: hypothetical protein IPH00_16915 [Flavobacteriales bacterium]|nr:hypothetical protein [Flavobacteriales bacterium]